MKSMRASGEDDAQRNADDSDGGMGRGGIARRGLQVSTSWELEATQSTPYHFADQAYGNSPIEEELYTVGFHDSVDEGSSVDEPNAFPADLRSLADASNADFNYKLSQSSVMVPGEAPKNTAVTKTTLDREHNSHANSRAPQFPPYSVRPSGYAPATLSPRSLEAGFNSMN